VRVLVNERVWRDFEQPHRAGWTYEGFGPLRFARDEYEAALAAAERSFPG
jgi:hypothetical protein